MAMLRQRHYLETLMFSMLLCLPTFSKSKFKHFASNLKVYFQTFPEPYSCVKLNEH